MKVAMAQINPTVGSLENNARKIKGIIQENTGKCDIIVFPEMALTGYPPQDLLLDGSFVEKAQDALREIATSAGATPVIIGTIRKESDNLFNTAAVLQDGAITAFRDKAHLPTYDVFDEDRYFTSAESIQPVELHMNGREYKLGIQICEDLWDEKYDLKVSSELIHAGAEILINISA